MAVHGEPITTPMMTLLPVQEDLAQVQLSAASVSLHHQALQTPQRLLQTIVPSPHQKNLQTLFVYIEKDFN